MKINMNRLNEILDANLPKMRDFFHRCEEECEILISDMKGIYLVLSLPTVEGYTVGIRDKVLGDYKVVSNATWATHGGGRYNETAVLLNSLNLLRGAIGKVMFSKMVARLSGTNDGRKIMVESLGECSANITTLPVTQVDDPDVHLKLIKAWRVKYCYGDLNQYEEVNLWEQV